MRPHDEIPEHLGRLIRASEVRISEQITALIAGRGAGLNTSEAEAQLWREMEALQALRRQQIAIYEMANR
ncbi:hypothetical protein [Methylobacterium sp. CCH5-D2]|uniref:hypothetical protein n=1 Tax=Methylobacterium sp. CCH5-D2 TaxID=1768765 RepID=UPI00083441D2|nr:hypothetical protein [Methylobacterium sp. CCH5-D2]